VRHGLSPELIRAYEATIFEAYLPSGTVTFRVGCRPRGAFDATAVGSISIVTAFNPGPGRPSAVKNAVANRRLQAELEAQDWSYYSALGSSPTINTRNRRSPCWACGVSRLESSGQPSARPASSGGTGGLGACSGVGSVEWRTTAR
jgi:hypothetical protein